MASALHLHAVCNIFRNDGNTRSTSATVAAFAVSIVKLPWDRVAEARSLNHEWMDTDMIILSAMRMLFASLAFVFFVMLKHYSSPPM